MTATDPCLLFALGRESRGFRRSVHARRRVTEPPGRAHRCRLHGQSDGSSSSVLVIETGVGRQRIQKALDWLTAVPVLEARPYIPGVVISAGFSGALHEHVSVGDVVVATEVRDTDGTTWPVSWSLTAAPKKLQRGRLLTVDRLIADPDEKRSLGRQHDALAVDMETATVARMCSRHGIPFGCIRVISDDVHTPLAPQLDAIIVNGRVSFARLMLHLCRRPGLARELWRLDTHTRLAAARLGDALAEVLRAQIGTEPKP